ncbi:MAG: hypothetical protein LBR39_06790 [Coriobacteriales bacterium]|nr:hypothetical protein [Coriobacteriales bacterium]
MARVAVAVVFVWNVQCALWFLLFPTEAAAGFGLSGAVGEAAIRGIAVAFLMWNATYPLVLINPVRHLALFGVVLAQQLIGLIGESWIFWTLLPARAAEAAAATATAATTEAAAAATATATEAATAMSASILRFIAFDAAGLLLMSAAFAFLLHSQRHAG